MSFIKKLFQCFFCWRIKPSPEKKVANADVIICQSFGLRRRSHGKSNKVMADIVEKIYKKYHLPLVSQWEVAHCLPKMPKAFIVRQHRVKREYLDTYESLCQQRVFCKTKGWTKAVMIAHPDHYWRCTTVAKKLGFDVIAVDTSSVPYDELSTQKWTRRSWLFIPREIVARITYLFTGKL